MLDTSHQRAGPAGFERVFLFYDRESPAASLPQVAAFWDVVARRVSRNGPQAGPADDEMTLNDLAEQHPLLPGVCVSDSTHP